MIARQQMAALATMGLLSLVGCGGSGPPPAGTLVLGGTDASGTGFFPLTGEQPLVPGSQGGFHVWVKFRLKGISPGTIQIKRTARRLSDNRLVLRAESVMELGPMGTSGYWESPDPLPSFMCPTPLGVDIRDQEISLEVEITDLEGTPLATATTRFVPHCPTDSQADFCANICSG